MGNLNYRQLSLAEFPFGRQTGRQANQCMLKRSFCMAIFHTEQNRQYIDNVPEYDNELQRITKSVHHKLDLGPISLQGAQQYTTVETAAALNIQDNSKSTLNMYARNDRGQYSSEKCKSPERIQSDGSQYMSEKYKSAQITRNDRGQYENEMYNRAESMIPQLDGTHNVSDSSNTDSYDYLDLANIDSMHYRTRGQKKKYKAELARQYKVNTETIKPNTRDRIQRQKVPDDEDIDINKIPTDDRPRYMTRRDLKDTLKDRQLEKQTKKNKSCNLQGMIVHFCKTHMFTLIAT